MLRLDSWYFSSNGYLRKKSSKNLNKHTLINEFLRLSKPGYCIGTLICIKQCEDGFFSTQSIMLEDPGPLLSAHFDLLTLLRTSYYC